MQCDEEDPAERAIRQRGKAAPGDKRVLDALVPAVDALEDAAQCDLPLLAALESAEAAAQKGLMQTKELQSRSGRAAYSGERTVGHPDAGAACFCLMLRSAIGYLGPNVS